jgi:hypothetical protein
VGGPSRFGPAPAFVDGELTPELAADLDLVFGDLASGDLDQEALARIGRSGDVRVTWLLADLLRFFQGGAAQPALVDAFSELTGIEIDDTFAWGEVTDHLIAWDLPAPPGYVSWKRALFELVEPGWKPFFDDTDAEIDWRLVSWGGVFIDDRPIDAVDAPCPDGCIPAINDPAVTNVAGGAWYPPERLVFGVEVNGEYRAYPKHQMEVHEMVNDTLGGRRIGVPYCTLCGSAQAYFTDTLGGDRPVELRTSGLLVRSNKVMFDLHTFSVFDTFTGRALSGPLGDEGVQLEQVSVVTTTWDEWRTAHPETTIIAEDGGLGRSYPLDPLGGRDDDGPIFPIGEVDPRLPVQEPVLGVVIDGATAIAFPVVAARLALQAGAAVEAWGVRVILEAGGLRATDTAGAPLVSHQAFWFAWSQFHPDTELWAPE